MTTHRLVITALTDSGTGIAFLAQRKIFVAGALLHEEVEVELYDEKPTYAQGKLVRIIKSSPERTPAICSYLCGGCAYPCWSYQAQLQYKRSQLLSLLQQVPNFQEAMLREVLGMAQPLGYRNKAIYAVDPKQGVIGLYAPNSHTIIPVQACALEQPWMNKARDTIAKLLTAELPLRYLYLRGVETSQKLAVLVCWQQSAQINMLATALHDAGIDNVLLNLNSTTGNRVLGDQFISLIGQDEITIEILGKQYVVKPDSFLQINLAQTEVLYQTALAMLQPQAHEQIADLYCGIGTISLSLASQVKEVWGIECVPAAIANAHSNAQLNGLTNAHFYCGLVEQVLPTLVQQGISFAGAVLDPARKGCAETVWQTLAQCRTPRLVYVSCNPVTQVRDILVAQKYGYTLQEVKAVDMFPYTSHLESIALLRRA